MRNTILLISYLLINLSACKEKDLAPNNDSYFSIPDRNFEQYLVEKKIDKDGIVNGKMAKEDTRGITELLCNQKEIQSLEGIEYFVDLKYLDCYKNKLTNLDVSKNLKLTDLKCLANNLTSLDLSKNLSLTRLECYDNQLKELNLRKNLN
ncbi:MAG: hypothetical protein U0V04_07185 [Spirosomataceae bacterium]|jgi:hypothetical protein